MRILGIDPGLSLTGYGCIDVDESGDATLVEAGVLRLKSKAPIAFRLRQLHDELAGIFDELHPGLAVVEQLFSHYKQVRTAILMGHARGVILLVAQARNIAIEEFAVTQVKRAITGNGHASKLQMQDAITTLCALRTRPEPPDVADAIALALCAARRISSPLSTIVEPGGAAEPTGVTTERPHLGT